MENNEITEDVEEQLKRLIELALKVAIRNYYKSKGNN
jgi:hypothetical protein